VGSRLDQFEDRVVPAWLRPTAGEHRGWVALAIVVAAGLQLFLSAKFTLVHPRWLLPSLEMALLVTLLAVSPFRPTRYSGPGRYLSLFLVGLISVDNGVSAVLLDLGMIRGTAGDQASPLLASAAAIYATNIIAFGVWYWELDQGGPFARASARHPYPDFLFPQMTQHRPPSTIAV